MNLEIYYTHILNTILESKQPTFSLTVATPKLQARKQNIKGVL